ncbi:putative TetR family transcriptional regulator [Gordonia effusa NBRC 100432]|uniref:Putative TetR family transcriptional regulator n=1 Tax=Gordonia effusa NBRC 100432 TaxID=1077974 RepID=H0R1K7_9ACTN|nr:TetR/AcrR family transcriptional regulator [Gordonia effusa]GAB18958.1 putative TetR family transcriptional regulator [Gordonia effusa NBRC 100432]
MTTTDQAATTRPLRADAARNRARIIDAARELFAERGLEVTLDDVAAHAGVGVGTVYRRFANREELIVGVFVDHLETIANKIRTAVADADPWESVVILLTTVGDVMASDRGLATVLTAVDHTAETMRTAKATVEELVTEIVEKAKSANAIRPEIETADFFGLVCMLAAIGDATQGTDGAWRRFAEILLDGLRGDGPRVPLTTPALTEEQIRQLDEHKIERLRRQ